MVAEVARLRVGRGPKSGDFGYGAPNFGWDAARSLATSATQPGNGPRNPTGNRSPRRRPDGPAPARARPRVAVPGRRRRGGRPVVPPLLPPARRLPDRRVRRPGLAAD